MSKTDDKAAPAQPKHDNARALKMTMGQGAPAPEPVAEPVAEPEEEKTDGE